MIIVEVLPAPFQTTLLRRRRAEEIGHASVADDEFGHQQGRRKSGGPAGSTEHGRSPIKVIIVAAGSTDCPSAAVVFFLASNSPSSRRLRARRKFRFRRLPQTSSHRVRPAAASSCSAMRPRLLLRPGRVGFRSTGSAARASGTGSGMCFHQARQCRPACTPQTRRLALRAGVISVASGGRDVSRGGSTRLASQQWYVASPGFARKQFVASLPGQGHRSPAVTRRRVPEIDRRSVATIPAGTVVA